MTKPTTALILLVAALHAGFLFLEMFAWTWPTTLEALDMNAAFAEQTRILAKNQGLYNGFLAAGLAWSTQHPNVEVGKQLARFFLTCVIVAGVYGSWSTEDLGIFTIQAVPAIVALIVVRLRG